MAEVVESKTGVVGMLCDHMAKKRLLNALNLKKGAELIDELPTEAEEKAEQAQQLIYQVSNLTQSERSDDTYYKAMNLEEAEMPPQSLISDIACGWRRAMKLNLFNFDVIRDTRVGNKYLVIDINYFPGYAKMLGNEKVLTDFFCDVFNKKQSGRFDGQLGMNCEKEVRILVGNNGLVEDEDGFPVSPLKMEEENGKCSIFKDVALISVAVLSFSKFSFYVAIDLQI
ncbi:hypothetical protein POM88_036960 [Heracleum sosnowskyi]|uniref:inositol-1,3,4-trisphosphate 5/6-kinase n=1 Tax=Heracleum sosnowskyi TaxID=360622 RepID=A0AAD8HQ93_9APIA|nr:hypothetical protein POM88_036960 [Heracleum sosnowskyi]